MESNWVKSSPKIWYVDDMHSTSLQKRLTESEPLKTKRIPPALGSKAALRDPVVEIDLTSKLLTDAGLLEVTAGLAKSGKIVTPQGRVVLLEELSLKDNGLTAASLSGLTSVMHLVCEDLRDLDLSDNAISVNEPDEVNLWEAFLENLSRCCVLRRLDLSGNNLGTKAFEVLARVYAREGPIDASLSEELDDLNLGVLKGREYPFAQAAPFLLLFLGYQERGWLPKAPILCTFVVTVFPVFDLVFTKDYNLTKCSS